MLWRPDLVWIHAFSDLLIAVAYFSIPLALTEFVRRRRDLRFKWIFWMFAGFITACGLTHVAGLVTLWQPYYGAQGLIKAGTALISLGNGGRDLALDSESCGASHARSTRGRK
jgi:hypothetical protein